MAYKKPNRNYSGVRFGALRAKYEHFFTDIIDDIDTAYYDYWQHGNSYPVTIMNPLNNKSKTFDLLTFEQKTNLCNVIEKRKDKFLYNKSLSEDADFKAEMEKDVSEMPAKRAFFNLALRWLNDEVTNQDMIAAKNTYKNRNVKRFIDQLDEDIANDNSGL